MYNHETAAISSCQPRSRKFVRRSWWQQICSKLVANGSGSLFSPQLQHPSYPTLLSVDDEEDAPLSIAKTFVLADLCIKFMYELHDFFWEEFNPSKVFTAHINAFWSFFLVDMRESMSHSQDTILKLQLFHTVNNYFSSQCEWRPGWVGEPWGVLLLGVIETTTIPVLKSHIQCPNIEITSLYANLVPYLL